MKNLYRKYPKKLVFAGLLFITYLILLIPLENSQPIQKGSTKPFIWNQDSLWKHLEFKFKEAKILGCDKIQTSIDSFLNSSKIILNEISQKSLQPTNEKYSTLEKQLFETAPLIPTCIDRFKEYINFYSRLREVIKEQSRKWDMNSIEAKNTIYRLLYGNRTAVEEIMLQLPPDKINTLINGVDETSQTPSSKILGVVVHSGDILVSRGGAPTSALIARGSDYPGNFSHIALVHIAENNKTISIIESHIERGVVISSIDEYLKDKKLRIMILRIRQDLIMYDPMIPHKAATYALENVKVNHIPYDFEMNTSDPEKQFCSEVASSAYKKLGINLWAVISNISSYGTRNWLSAFGVKYFQTEEPSDLEYDPQLSVVAEWRDSETLYKDHLDNAVTDVMLEKADSGKVLSYDWYALPIGRLAKLYSLVLNIFDEVGPIPEGMSPEAALKNKKYSEDHELIKNKLVELAKDFETEKGYRAPYWELVELGRIARDAVMNN
ncbi:MAG: YiiX/YebB-like N1pC/P60 family cysteine hydrolase [Ignavibacteriaceae bacterium]